MSYSTWTLQVYIPKVLTFLCEVLNATFSTFSRSFSRSLDVCGYSGYHSYILSRQIHNQNYQKHQIYALTLLEKTLNLIDLLFLFITLHISVQNPSRQPGVFFLTLNMYFLIYIESHHVEHGLCVFWSRFI